MPWETGDEQTKVGSHTKGPSANTAESQMQCSTRGRSGLPANEIRRGLHEDARRRARETVGADQFGGLVSLDGPWIQIGAQRRGGMEEAAPRHSTNQSEGNMSFRASGNPPALAPVVFVGCSWNRPIIKLRRVGPSWSLARWPKKT